MSQDKVKKKEREQAKEGDGLPPQTLAEKIFLGLLCASCIVFTLLVTFYQPFRVIGIGEPPAPPHFLPLPMLTPPFLKPFYSLPSHWSRSSGNRMQYSGKVHIAQLA
jgi:hypothetical protein